MSHVISVQVSYQRLDLLQKACISLGWDLKEGQKTFKWFGSWVDDYHNTDAAYNNGVKTEDYGKCDHAIVVPGCSYEIGVIGEEGNWRLIWDAYSCGGLDKVLGSEEFPLVVNPLPQAYSREAVLEKLGDMDVWSVEESRDIEGNLRLEVNIGE